MSKPKTKYSFRDFGRVLYVFLKRWTILIIAAILLTWYLQYRISNNSAESAWKIVDDKPVIFWYSSLIIFTLLVIFYGIIYKPFSAIGIMFAIITIIAYINNTKMAFRGAPLLPEDFQLADQAGTLTDFIDVGQLARIILASVMAVGLGILLDYITRTWLSYITSKSQLRWRYILFKKAKKTKKAKKERKKLIAIRTTYEIVPRAIIITAGIFGFIAAINPIIHSNDGSSKKIEWLDAEFVSWSQTLNYEQNTFLLGFLYNLTKSDIEKPKDYKKEKVAEIKNSYEKKAKDSANASKKSLKEADYNIVIILNESFYDPSFLRELYPFNGPDPLPVFHEIMEKYPSGYMYSPEYGGGTANIEFEVNTGLSNFWAQTTPYTSLLPKLGKITSTALEAKSSGYETAAIHSYTGEMYKRSYVLPIEGFDKFITQNEMKHTERDNSSGGYINDRSIYAEALDLIENSEKKQFINVLTMQDHAPYERASFNEEDLLFLFDDPNSTIDLADPITAYVQGVHYSDEYLGEFLENLKNSNEKTVVLFFGDHAPGIFGAANTNSNKAIADLTHLTPYFIWSNFETDDTFSDKKYGKEFLSKFGNAFLNEEDIEDKSNNDRDDVFTEISKNITLPTTSPNCLVNSLYGVLNLRRNAKELLLADVCAEEPILAPAYLADKKPTGKAASNYEILNYDILNGKQYWF